MDCSAFVNYMLYHYAGIDLNGLNCAGMAAAFRSNAIPKSWVCSANDLVAGDIIIRLTGSTNHVVIYVGRNQYGLPMVIDEFGTDTVGNVMYQQKQIYYFEDGQSVFVHLDIQESGVEILGHSMTELLTSPCQIVMRGDTKDVRLEETECVERHFYVLA